MSENLPLQHKSTRANAQLNDGAVSAGEWSCIRINIRVQPDGANFLLTFCFNSSALLPDNEVLGAPDCGRVRIFNTKCDNGSNISRDIVEGHIRALEIGDTKAVEFNDPIDVDLELVGGKIGTNQSIHGLRRCVRQEGISLWQNLTLDPHLGTTSIFRDSLLLGGEIQRFVDHNIPRLSVTGFQGQISRFTMWTFP